MKKFFSWFLILVIICTVIWLVFWKFKIPLLQQLTLILLMAFAMCLHRIFIGPTPADRAISVDTIGILVVGFCGLMGIFTGIDWYIDIAIAWALQSFIGTLALAKYLEGRNFDE